MRFSVFLNARSMSPAEDGRLITDLIGHAEHAAAQGFEAVFMPDHHFNGYMPVASDSFILAGYLAARLPDMHFGFSVVSVPLHHPVRQRPFAHEENRSTPSGPDAVSARTTRRGHGQLSAPTWLASKDSGSSGGCRDAAKIDEPAAGNFDGTVVTAPLRQSRLQASPARSSLRRSR